MGTYIVERKRRRASITQRTCHDLTITIAPFLRFAAGCGYVLAFMLSAPKKTYESVAIFYLHQHRFFLLLRATKVISPYY